LPFEHPIQDLKREPSKALYPQAKFTPSRASWKFWLLLPFIFIKLLRANGKLAGITRTFAQEFRDKIVPPFLEETRTEAQADLGQLTPDALLERLHYWIRRTLTDFARDSLKPTALADNVQNQLLVALTRLNAATGQAAVGNKAAAVVAGERAQARLRQLVMGVRPDPDADLPGAVQQLAAGQLDRETFLRKFGHRGHNEMELAQPRWSEAPDELDRLVKQHHLSPLTPNSSPPSGGVGSDLSPHSPAGGRGVGREREEIKPAASPFADDKLTGPQRAALEQYLQLLHSYLALRETGKHHLMRGYALIRRLLLELDRRYHLEGGIFYLTFEELPALVRGEDVHARLEPRRRQRELLLKLTVPPVLFSDDLEAIGRAVPAAAKDSYQGIPLSAGVVEGPALVLHELPDTIPDGEPYVLVCPSTDPAWMPLFVRARALVMETGGMLSHGAIVAREFGLPAVAGLPDIHRLVRTGQRLHVDGSSGRVNVLA
jgi:pyruvate,water dikinase